MVRKKADVEVIDEVEETETPKTTRKVNGKGTAWLAEHVNEKLGTSYTPYNLRVLLRKMVQNGELPERDGRYDFKGERDPQVTAIVKALKAGKAEAAKKERIDKAQESSTKAKTTRAKAKAAETDDEEEGEAPAPKPARRTRKAAPKAKPEADDDDLDLDEI